MAEREQSVPRTWRPYPFVRCDWCNSDCHASECYAATVVTPNSGGFKHFLGGAYHRECAEKASARALGQLIYLTRLLSWLTPGAPNVG